MVSEPVSPAPRCSHCGSVLSLSPNLVADLAELAEIPSAAAAQVLCAVCSAPASSSSTSAPNTTQDGRPEPPSQPLSQPPPMFRVRVTMSERSGTDSATQADSWEDIGGFTIQGAARTVREFVESKTIEWDQRMEMVLRFADSEAN